MFHDFLIIIGHNIARKLGKNTMFGDKKLVGGLEHEFYDFPFSWECHDPNWLTHIFQRGRLNPPTR